MDAMRRPVWQVLALCMLIAGCESAETKCARLQTEAAAAWGAYAGVLEKAAEDARRAHAGAKAKAEAMEQQLIDAARKQADSLYEPKSSAWWRAVDAAQQTLCTKDAQCMELKTEMAEAEGARKELTARLGAVRAAQNAATGAAGDAKSAEAARTAAAAVDDDFDRGEIKPARAASATAGEACAAVER
jgi:hypothetical protein